MAEEAAAPASSARQEGEDSTTTDTKSTATKTMPTWTQLLDEAKQQQDESPLEAIQPYMRRFAHQISSYGNAVKDSKLTKENILQTRAALRFATMCLSNEETRPILQKEAVIEYQWQLSLSFVLSQKKGDAKCRVLMARLFSNLVTSNSQTATAVATTIPLSPSHEDIEMMLRTTLTIEYDARKRNTETTWVDMMLACGQSSSRDGLAAIVAALYNCMLSIPSSQSFLGEPFPTRVASDRLLVSTLLRKMLPASYVTPDALATNDESGPGDFATEWIVRTIEKLCCLGQLPALYVSAGGEVMGDGTATVTPELIVLLHCVARAVHDDTAPDSDTTKPLLGRDAGDIATVSCHVDLANRFCLLNKSQVLSELSETQAQVLPDRSEEKGEDENSQTVASSDPALVEEAWFLALGILATSLGTDDHVSMAETRLAIGRDTPLIQDVSVDLGTVVDSLSAANQSRNARDLVISDDEQRRITSLVQLLGNVCYRCRQNQDLVRQTIVPFPPPPPGTTVCDSCVERTALHVLLSCTSFSYGCFTLREWAIIALRNVLEGNEANQKLVEQLEAQQPMQSAELEGMGLRVNMDPDGKVRVVPTDAPTGATADSNDAPQDAAT